MTEPIAATPGRRFTTGAFWAEAAVLGVAMVWGASYPVAKEALLYAPALALIFWRFLITATAMSAIARRELAQSSRRDRLKAMTLGAILCAIFLAETFGVARTSATNAALIISLCVVMTPFLDFGLSRRLPPSGVVFGAALAVAGAGLLAGGASAFSQGDLLILIAAGLRAVMVVATKRLMADAKLSAAALTAIQAATVASLTLVLTLGISGAAAFALPSAWEFWLAIGFLSLFCTIAAFYVQNAALRRASPTRVGFLMGTEPIFGVAFAWLLLSEPLTLRVVCGAGLILAGTFWGMAAERRSSSDA